MQTKHPNQTLCKSSPQKIGATAHLSPFVFYKVVFFPCPRCTNLMFFFCLGKKSTKARLKIVSRKHRETRRLTSHVHPLGPIPMRLPRPRVVALQRCLRRLRQMYLSARSPWPRRMSWLDVRRISDGNFCGTCDLFFLKMAEKGDQKIISAN